MEPNEFVRPTRDDVVRVLRVIEYVGTRKKVEACLQRSIHGSKILPVHSNGEFLSIFVSTVGVVPEIRMTAESMDEPTYIPDLDIVSLKGEKDAQPE